MLRMSDGMKIALLAIGRRMFSVSRARNSPGVYHNSLYCERYRFRFFQLTHLLKLLRATSRSFIRKAPECVLGSLKLTVEHVLRMTVTGCCSRNTWTEEGK
jgi:hypothetical protein